MTAAIKIENESCDHDHALLGWLVIQKLQSTYMQNLTNLASAVPEISLGDSKFKVGHVTLTTPHLRVICHSYAGT